MAEQGTETKVEGAVEATEPKVEPTEKTRTEEDFQRAVSKGLESITTQLNLRNGEVKVTKAEAESTKAELEGVNADLQVLQRQHDDLVGKQFADDPEARQAYVDRRAIDNDRRTLLKEKVGVERKLYDAEKLAWSGAMALKSIELKSKFQVPQEVLDTCVTEEQMDTIAKAFPEVKTAEEVKKPTFDSVTSSGTGVDVSAMSPTQKITYALTHSKK